MFIGCYLASAGDIQDGELQWDNSLRALMGVHLFVCLWTITAFECLQLIVIAGAVSQYYWSRDKNVSPLIHKLEIYIHCFLSAELGQSHSSILANCCEVPSWERYVGVNGPGHSESHQIVHARARSHDVLHGEKVAYGILVQLRLEVMIQRNQLAASPRKQLLEFSTEIGLPKNLEDLGLTNITLAQLRQVAAIATAPQSDLHRLPFTVNSEQLVAAMVSTTVETVATANSKV